MDQLIELQAEADKNHHTNTPTHQHTTHTRHTLEIIMAVQDIAYTKQNE
jgi:phosphopentomutase